MEYIAIIAEAMDQEIESSEELVQMYRDDNMPEVSGVVRFDYDLKEGESEDVIRQVAYGYLFSLGWSLDDTVSWVGRESEVA